MAHIIDEDRALEVAVNAADEARGAEKAQNLSDSSYEWAVDECLERGNGLFESRRGRSDAPANGERLADKLTMAAKKMAFGIASAELLTPDEGDWLIAAFTLPFDIHYTEYGYVGSDGNSAEGPEFDEDERWEPSEETDIRDAVCEAAREYCLMAGAVAKDIGAQKELRLFARALALIETNCIERGYENDIGGMSAKEAGLVSGWMYSATQSLWAQSSIHARLLKLHPSATMPKLTARQKRADELLIKSFSGEITPEEEHELMPGAEPVPSRDKVSNPTATVEKPIVLGEWAKGVVFSAEAASRTVVFKGNQGGAGAELSVPSTSQKAWTIVRMFLEAEDSEGWVKLPKELRKWRPHFYRTRKNHDLKALLGHIRTFNKPGKRGPTKIRLERRERNERAKAKKNNIQNFVAQPKAIWLRNKDVSGCATRRPLLAQPSKSGI